MLKNFISPAAGTVALLLVSALGLGVAVIPNSIRQMKQTQRMVEDAGFRLRQLQRQIEQSHNGHAAWVPVSRAGNTATHVRTVFDSFGIEPETMDFGHPIKKADADFWQQDIAVSFVASYADIRALLGDLDRAIPGVSIQVLKLTRADMEIGWVACDLGLRATYIDQPVEAHAN